jgi:hypothetical protein
MNITTNDVVKRTYQELFEIWRHVSDWRSLYRPAGRCRR